MTLGERDQRLEKMLRARRAELAADLVRHIGNRVEEDTLTSQHEQIEIGDRAVAIHGQDIELTVVDMKRRQVREIDDALRRLREGSYGFCSECETDIGEERLEALPFAAECVDCKRRLEAEAGVEKTGRGFRAGFRDIREDGGDDD